MIAPSVMGGLSQLGAADVILRVEGLRVHFPITHGAILRRKTGAIRAVDGVDLDLRQGETLGLVGETGCGKSTLGRAILQLNPITDGSVFFEGRDLATVRGAHLRRIRRRMQMVFQDPYSSLNPRLTVGSIIGEPLEVHGIARGRAKRDRVRSLMQQVGLNADHDGRYPHEFSGGQRQRIGIARALALDPALIVADEPISALDVSIQAQIVNLLEELQAEYGLAYLFIAHDLSVVRHISDRVAVMYLGKLVEVGECDDLYERPRHPYTVALLSAVPIPDPDEEAKRQRIILSGDVPSPADPPSGCRFRTRCWLREALGNPENCTTQEPELRVVDGRHVACHWAETLERRTAGGSLFGSAGGANAELATTDS